MKHRLILWFLVIMVFAQLTDLWATGTQEKVAGQPVVLKFWRGGTQKPWNDYFLDSVERFTAANPNIKIEYSDFPLGSEIETKLNTAYATGTSPDIVGHAIMSIALRAEKKHYEPMTKYIETWEERDKIIPTIFGLSTYKGTVYGLAYCPAVHLQPYRKDFFVESGLDPEQPPKDWSTLADAAVKLTRREGDKIVRTGMSIPIENFNLIIPYARMNGGMVHDAEGNPTWDSPEWVETLEYLTDLYLNKKVAGEEMWQGSGAVNLFYQGRAAIGLATLSGLETMWKDAPDLKTKIGYITVAKNGRTSKWVGADQLFISSQTKYQDQAWEFIKFIFKSDETWRRYKDLNFPVVREDLVDRYIADNQPLNKAIMDAVKVGAGAPLVPWATPLMFKYMPAAQQEAYYGKKTPAQALKDNLKLLKEEIAQTK